MNEHDETRRGLSAAEFSEAWQTARDIEKQELADERRMDDRRLRRIAARLAEALGRGRSSTA